MHGQWQQIFFGQAASPAGTISAPWARCSFLFALSLFRKCRAASLRAAAGAFRPQSRPAGKELRVELSSTFPPSRLPGLDSHHDATGGCRSRGQVPGGP